MSIHQVITGALNSGENSFSIGCVDGVSFIVSNLHVNRYIV